MATLDFNIHVSHLNTQYQHFRQQTLDRLAADFVGRKIRYE